MSETNIPEPRHVQFVIEITDRLNCAVRDWPPTQRKLRGAWKHENTRNLDFDTEGRYAALRRMRDIPGLHVFVDTKKRQAKVFDPLADPDNKPLLDHFTSVYDAAGFGKQGAERIDAYEDMSKDDLKTWLYWARRLLDARQAETRNGTSVPSMKEIEAMPGTLVRPESDEFKPDSERVYRPMNHDQPDR